MDKHTHDFETWFEILVDLLSDRGVFFSDDGEVAADYNEGKDVHDVADEIEKELGDDGH